MGGYPQRCERELIICDLSIEILKNRLNIKYSYPIKVFDRPITCPICLDTLENQIAPLSCGHWAHKICMDAWCLHQKHDTCPTCKQKYITYTK